MEILKLKHSIGARLAIISFLSILLLIPSLLIQELITERNDRRDSVAGEISQKWGNEQTITGPIISVPYRHYIENGDTVEQSLRYAHFLPENLYIEGVVITEERYRGIYNVIVYNSSLAISGNFLPLNLTGLNVSPDEFIFEDAFVSVGISDMTGIREFININWNGTEHAASPGIVSNDVLESGISISPEFGNGNQEYEFKFDLNLNGSSGLLFSPIGKQTTIELSSDWSNPGFKGNFLPVNREINSSGFRADWEVLHLNRNFPQQWLGSGQNISETTFGVDLLLAVDEYQMTMRSAKYAIMFISLTFLTFFMIELLCRKIIHPLQYLLIGMALLIFYTILLAISEYLVFGMAYIIASAAVILLITIYSWSVLSDKRQSGLIFGILVALYGYLYILMQLQDYALLMGSVGLFIVLALVMYLTREIDWFDIMKSQIPIAKKSEHAG